MKLVVWVFEPPAGRFGTVRLWVVPWKDTLVDEALPPAASPVFLVTTDETVKDSPTVPVIEEGSSTM